MIKKALILFMAITFASACIPLTPGTDPTATPDFSDIATRTAAAMPTATLPFPTASSTATPPATSESTIPTPAPVDIAQFIAYIKEGHLLVTDVTNNMQGGTTQYSVAGESDQVIDLAWSPSGEYVAFVSTAQGDPRIFYIYALGQSSPADLGPGSAIAWSPDNRSIAYIGGVYPDENILITSIEHVIPRQLTFESNYAWGRPVFTPDGSSLVVAGTDRNNMGASGNTNFTLEYLALDGSGARTALPGAAPFEGVRLPYNLHFSPDGTRLAFSTSYHLSACAVPGAYYVSSADGSNLQTLVSPSLQPLVDPGLDRYFEGLSYTWTSASDAIVALGNVMDCNLDSPTTGQSIGGPQMSIIGLDGSERTIIPGFFYEISMDRTGSLIAAGHYQNGFQDMNPNIEIYSAQNGQLILPLGPGYNPRFQP